MKIIKIIFAILIVLAAIKTNITMLSESEGVAEIMDILKADNII